MEEFDPNMKHLIEARNGALQVLEETTKAGLAQKLCLIVDLQGRLRVLAKLGDQHEPVALQLRLDQDLGPACEDFWTKEVWFDRDKTHPMGKASPAELALFARGWAEARPAPSGAGVVFVLDRRYSKE
jgi:hypothetical protein